MSERYDPLKAKVEGAVNAAQQRRDEELAKEDTPRFARQLNDFMEGKIGMKPREDWPSDRNPAAIKNGPPVLSLGFEFPYDLDGQEFPVQVAFTRKLVGPGRPEFAITTNLDPENFYYIRENAGFVQSRRHHRMTMHDVPDFFPVTDGRFGGPETDGRFNTQTLTFLEALLEGVNQPEAVSRAIDPPHAQP